MSAKIVMIGSGSWATALVKLLLNNATEISWYVRKEEDVAHMKAYGHNPRYLSSVNIDHSRVRFFTSPGEALAQGDLVVLAVPSAFVHKTLEAAGPEALRGKTVFSAI